MGPTLVILAAGAGTRYGGLKQLAAIGPGDETLLEYSAFDAARVGFERVVLVVSPHDEAAFRERLDAGMARHLPVRYVHQRLDDLPVGVEAPTERSKPWGTVQAVLAAEAAVGGPFAVVNADDFYGAASYAALAVFLGQVRGGRELAAVGFEVAETLADGGPVARALLEVDGARELRAIVEMPEVWRQEGGIHCRDRDGRRWALEGDELVSMNMWGFTPELLPRLQAGFADFVARHGHDPEAELLLPDAVEMLVRAGCFKVRVLRGSGVSCGITFPQDRRRVSCVMASLVESGSYPKELWA